MASDLGAIGSGGDFRGFEPADFDAYEKKKWSSNAYTLARRNAKDKLLALAKVVERDLEEELSDLELGASEEAPSVANGRTVKAQWVFFTRASGARAALKPHLQKTDLASGASLFDISVQHQHACLMLRVDHQGFAIGVEIATKATVDRDNAREKLRTERAPGKLIDLCKSLPGEALIGPENDRVLAIDLTPDQVAGWPDALAGGDQPFVAEALIGRDEDILQSEHLIATAEEYVAAFVPVFRFLAWSPENDHTEVAGAIEQEKAVREQAARSFSAGDRVVMMSGLFAGRAGYIAEINKGKAKVMVGPVSVSVDVDDLKAG